MTTTEELSPNDQRLVDELYAARDLLAEFDSRLIGKDPGVLATCPNNRYHSLSFEAHEWGWLEPLLKELLALRKKRDAALAAHSEGLAHWDFRTTMDTMKEALDG
jgi:hypothetical protein